MTDESTETTESPKTTGTKELLRVPYDIIRDVDMTPDGDLPIRILEAYRTNCNILFNLDNIDDENKELCGFLNDNAEKGGKIFTRVLDFLKANRDKWDEV
jgi:hypothetical protein